MERVAPRALLRWHAQRNARRSDAFHRPAQDLTRNRLSTQCSMFDVGSSARRRRLPPCSDILRLALNDHFDAIALAALEFSRPSPRHKADWRTERSTERTEGHGKDGWAGKAIRPAWQGLRITKTRTSRAQIGRAHV